MFMILIRNTDLIVPVIRSMTQTLIRLLVGCLLILSTACTGPAVTGAFAPTGGPGIMVTEYPLVEQSVDNPDHAGFSRYAQTAVTANHSNRFHDSNETETLNIDLGPYGMHLECNPVPPYSGYALYHGDTLLQGDIARFWPVSPDGLNIEKPGDIAFAFETFRGEKIIASSQGISPWIGQPDEVSHPEALDQDQRLAFASVDGDMSFLGASEQPPLPVENDGQTPYLYRQMIAGSPFVIENHNGLVNLIYQGQNLSYRYDMVVTGLPGDLVILNPGGSGDTAWFFALRDGLWYYVEISFEK
jgi:hypothetical protein